MRLISTCSAAFALVLFCGTIGAQTAAPGPQPKPLAGSIASHPEWPKAKKADVESVDSLMAALYDVISGPAGKARDWERFRSLFLPDGTARRYPAPSREPAQVDARRMWSS